jgi:RHS repeat-associated protein
MTLSYTYDGFLPLSATWTGEVTGKIARGYDNNFRVVSETINDGSLIGFGYDDDGLLTTAGGLNLTYNTINGLLTGSILGSVTDSWGYSSFGEAANYVARYSGGTIFENQFTRDKLGRIIQKTETVAGVTTVYDYTYDQTGRLTQVKKNGVVFSTYAYDTNSNRLSRVTSSETEGGTYDAQDRLSSYGNFNYTYTANGELKTKTDTATAQTTQYDYDLMGNLLKVNLPDGKQIDYVIDGQNRRVGKKVNGALTQGFLYDGQIQIAAELDGSSNVISRFIYAEKGNVPSYMIKGGQTYRIISDHLGSPRLVVDTATGTIAQQLDYDEFGRVINDTNPGFQPFGFAGGLYDADTGLVRFGLRDYDAMTGRWTSKDPIFFAGGDTNVFGYVVNDPVNWSDPFGLMVPIDTSPYDPEWEEAQRERREQDYNEIMYGTFCPTEIRPREPSTYDQLSWGIGMVAIPNYQIVFWRYPNAGGGGINILNNGKRAIGFDWHKFKVNGKQVNLPHIDIPGIVKHWPWGLL